MHSNEASSLGASAPALATLIQELATFFLPDMLKMLKAFSILVHYEDELPPAFEGTSDELAQTLVLQAPAVAPAPMASSSILTAPAAVPHAPLQPPCSPLCTTAKLSYVKAASSKVPLVAPPKPYKLSIYTKVGT